MSGATLQPGRGVAAAIPVPAAAPPAGASRRWLGRLAQGAFWFFLAKGLLWLTLPVAAWLGWGGLGG